jgi:CheY-like chemotaxis protein
MQNQAAEVGLDPRTTLEAGFDHHLIKPVDPDQLAGLIAS